MRVGPCSLPPAGIRECSRRGVLTPHPRVSRKHHDSAKTRRPHPRQTGCQRAADAGPPGPFAPSPSLRRSAGAVRRLPERNRGNRWHLVQEYAGVATCPRRGEGGPRLARARPQLGREACSTQTKSNPRPDRRASKATMIREEKHSVVGGISRQVGPSLNPLPIWFYRAMSAVSFNARWADGRRKHNDG